MKSDDEISVPEAKIFRVLRDNKGKWLTNLQIEELCKGNNRTIRMYTKRFVLLGLLDVLKVFPGYRFRWSDKGATKNRQYVARVEEVLTFIT